MTDDCKTFVLFWFQPGKFNLHSWPFPPPPCERSGASCGESVDDPTSQVQHLTSSAESGSDRWYFHSLCWPRDAVVLLDCSVLVFVSPVSPGIHLPSQAEFGQSAAAATELLRVEDEGGLTCVWKDMSQWCMTQWWYTTQWYYHHRACCLCLWLFELLFIHPFSMAVPGRVPPWTSSPFIRVSQRRTNKHSHSNCYHFPFSNSPHMHCGRKLHIVILVANLHSWPKHLSSFLLTSCDFHQSNLQRYNNNQWESKWEFI